MSIQDSIGTVYKCMMRGAADYLVKPIRRNELRNLWQHVWRRRSLTFCGSAPQDESVTKRKAEATDENNNSGGSMGCLQTNKDYIEKGSDEQVASCSSLALAQNQTYQLRVPQSKSSKILSLPTLEKSSPNSINVQSCEAYSSLGEGSYVGICIEANTATSEPITQRGDANELRMTSLKIGVPLGLPIPQLFTRYTHRPMHESENSSENNHSKTVGDTKSDARDRTISAKSGLSFGIGISNQSVVATSSMKQRVVPVQVKSVRFNNSYDHFRQSNKNHYHVLEEANDRGQVSCTTDRSTTSSSGNGGLSHLGNGSASGSNGNETEESCFSSSGNGLRSILREAALKKFHMKRKDRCSSSQIRYESRKKLAEQRPRVKGQFLRQANIGSPPIENDNLCDA
ncbi:two-component response regulator-like APRR5 [Rutidosis leptorrhynchoides]|uniref:two-component response regulator-like APRR5 n=1 Tax=Rutidosis leptorrhynchoides TaxID=125765 RepID=UPI003A999D24